MSGNRRGGPPTYDNRRSSGYKGSSPRSRNDWERDDREQESLRYKERGWVRDRDRDRDRDSYRPRSRSPSRKPEGQRPLRRDDSPMGLDNRDSSSVSSMTNSPALSNRALNNNNYTLNGSLAPKPNLDLPPPPPKEEPPSDSIPLPPPADLPILGTSTFDNLITGFLAFIDEAAQASALGVSLNTARESFNQRALEFHKSTIQHEKFPNVKSSQREQKDLAETRYQTIEQQLEQQKSQVTTLATKAMEQLIPQVASMAASAKEKELREENQKVQQRCDSLEKSLQELVQTVTAQAQYIKDIQNSNALKLAEERIEHGVRAEFKKVKDQFEGVHSDLLASTNNMELLRKELDDAKASITKAESSVNDALSLKAEFKIDSANTRKYISEQQQSVSDLEVLREQVKTEISQRKQEITALTQDVKDIKTTPRPQAQPELSSNMFISIKNRITAAEKSFDSLSGRLEKVETDQQGDSKFKTYEKKVERLDEAVQGTLRAVEDRVTTLESSRNDFKGELLDAITADFNKLEERVNEVAETPKAETAISSSNEVTAVSADDLKEVNTRLAQVEQSIQTIQISQSSPAPLASSLPAPSIPDNVSSKFTQTLTDLRVELEEMRALQNFRHEAVLKSVNDLVETAIDQEVMEPLGDLQKTVKSYESFMGLPAKVHTLETLHANHTSEMNALKQNLTADIIDQVLQSVHDDHAIVSHTRLEHRLASLQAALNNALMNTNGDVLGLQNSHSQISNEVQALTNVSNNHETRMNNLTTGQMTNHIMDQLKETIPNLQIAGTLRADFDLLRQKIENLTTNYRTLLSSSKKNDDSIQGLERAVAETKNTASTRFKDLILNTEDLAKRIDGVNDQLDNPNKPATDLKAELDALREKFTTLKDTQVHDLSNQLETLNNEFRELKKTHPDNLIPQLNGYKVRLDSLEDLKSSFEEIKEKIEALSTIHEQVPSMQNEIATQQQQIVKFNEKQEKLSELDGKVTELTEKLKEDQVNIAEMEGQLTTMGKKFEALETQAKSRPAHLNTAVNGVNGRSSPTAPRSAPISSYRNRQESIASTASDSNRSIKTILPPKPSEATPKPSVATPTMNRSKNRSTNATGSANNVNNTRSSISIDPNKSRSVRSETHKPAPIPTGSDLNPKKRKLTKNASSISEAKSSSTSGNARPASKKPKNCAFASDDDDDETDGNIERPKLAAEDVESDDDVIFMGEVKRPVQKPTSKVPGDDQDFKRDF